MKTSNQKRRGFAFKTYEAPYQTPFEKLFEIFKELITYTSGDFDEAIDWLRELDKEYELTDQHYTIDDFIEDTSFLRFILPWPSQGIILILLSPIPDWRPAFMNE